MRIFVFEHIADGSRSMLPMLPGRVRKGDLNAATLVDADTETRHVS